MLCLHLHLAGLSLAWFYAAPTTHVATDQPSSDRFEDSAGQFCAQLTVPPLGGKKSDVTRLRDNGKGSCMGCTPADRPQSSQVVSDSNQAESNCESTSP